MLDCKEERIPTNLKNPDECILLAKTIFVAQLQEGAGQKRNQPPRSLGCVKASARDQATFLRVELKGFPQVVWASSRNLQESPFSPKSVRKPRPNYILPLSHYIEENTVDHTPPLPCFSDSQHEQHGALYSNLTTKSSQTRDEITIARLTPSISPPPNHHQTQHRVGE